LKGIAAIIAHGGGAMRICGEIRRDEVGTDSGGVPGLGSGLGQLRLRVELFGADVPSGAPLSSAAWLCGLPTGSAGRGRSGSRDFNSRVGD
jgi:hypothetical protein